MRHARSNAASFVARLFARAFVRILDTINAAKTIAQTTKMSSIALPVSCGSRPRMPERDISQHP
jgi:hypothetical protein